MQLTPGNSNLQGTKENTSIWQIFELSETPVKANSDKNERLVRVMEIFSWGNITKWRVEQTKISW